MDDRQALSSFAALAQETRLSIVRTLVVAGPEGLAAGDTLADLVTFLMEDCCAGHPGIRGSVERSASCCSNEA